MALSAKYNGKLFWAFLALSKSLQIGALPIEDCIGEYLKYAKCPPESCTETDVRAAMNVFFKKKCPKPGPRKDGSTPACCFITPPLIRITADEAFDAFQSQTMPDFQGGERKGVIMIDVRTPDELYWVGQAAQVNSITLNGEEAPMTPENYKANLKPDGESGVEIVTDSLTIKPADVSKVDLSPTFFNVPVEFLDAATVTKTLNRNFGESIKDLLMAFPSEAVIFTCRSGNRSTIGCYVWYCSEFLDPTLSAGKTFYEVEAWAGDDRTVEINGRGGFEGASSDNKYLGYRGFPGRLETGSDVAVDFKDFGLPIITSLKPQTLKDHSLMKSPYACIDDPSLAICNRGRRHMRSNA